MAELNSNIQDLLNNIDEQINIAFEQKEYKKIIDLELEKWSLLPQPKEIWDDSFHIAKSLVDEYTKLNEEENSIKWAKIIQNCDPERVDSGEKEFILGMTYFEFGKYELSHSNLETTFKKSAGREFEGEHPKYKDFFLNPEKYIKE